MRLYNAYYNDNRWPYIYSSWTTSGYRSLHFYSYNNYIEYVALPDFEIDSIRNLELYFAMCAINNYSDSRIVVGVMDNRYDYSTFTPVDTVSCTASGTYQYQHVSLSSYRGVGRFIALRYLITTSSWRELAIDDLRVNSHAAPVIALTAATTARIVGNGGRSPYWIEYCTSSHTQGDSTNTWFYVESDTAYITGLSPNTTYNFYHHVDSADITCFPVLSITTSYLQTIPYCEEFNGYGSGSGAFPTGWRRYTSNNDNNRLYVHNDGDAVDYRSLRFEIYNGL